MGSSGQASVSLKLLKNVSERSPSQLERFSFEPFLVAFPRLRERTGLTYRQLAYKTGLSAGYLNHLSKGCRPTPSNEQIERIAKALHVEPDYFLEYRQRVVKESLDYSPQLVMLLYNTLKRHRDH